MPETSFNPNDEQLLSQALHYLSINRIESADNLLRQLLAHNPEEGVLHYLLAQCQFASDEYDDALSSCREALQNGYSNEDCALLTGKIYTETGDAAQSETAFLEALSINPENAESLAAYGFLMMKSGFEKKAQKLMEEAMRLDPEDESVLNYCFYFQLAKNNPDEQLSILKKQLLSSSSEINNALNIGMRAYYMEDYKSAEENFRQAFLLDPTNEDLLELLVDTAKQAHPIYLPQRLIMKMGGVPVLWLAMVGILFLLFYLHLEKAAVTFLVFYLVLVVYTWVTPLLYKLIRIGK
ncbi:MAG: tetratricopeptide repeat protein [bacterium]|nr:tetratricopeptide repeat protein [bacterium]